MGVIFRYFNLSELKRYFLLKNASNELSVVKGAKVLNRMLKKFCSVRAHERISGGVGLMLFLF
ncbi:hypothetical protein BM1374166_01755 [Bartonella tribocorum]|nr:hypothetical protein BM1374166_01755 [Bartonella tribocorum]